MLGCKAVSLSGEAHKVKRRQKDAKLKRVPQDSIHSQETNGVCMKFRSDRRNRPRNLEQAHYMQARRESLKLRYLDS